MQEAESERAGQRSKRGPLVALLVGGQSRRFGSDKAEQEIDGRSFQSLILDAVDGAELPVVLVGGSPERAAVLGRPHVPDIEGGVRGPTAGLAAALTFAEKEGHAGVVLLACDQPGVTTGVLDSICAKATARPHAPWALVGPTGLEPFPAYYPVRALAFVEAARSLREALAGADPSVRIERREDQADWPAWALDNINTPDDLERHLEKRLSRNRPSGEARSSGS